MDPVGLKQHVSPKAVPVVSFVSLLFNKNTVSVFESRMLSFREDPGVLIEGWRQTGPHQIDGT